MPAPATADVIVAADGAAHEIAGLAPLARTASVSGPAATCRCAPQDNLALHRLLSHAPAGAVLVCEAGGRRDRGHFGELMALDALNRGLRGLVIDGSVRDGAALLSLDFPVFHLGFAPEPCVKSEAPSVGEPVELGGVLVSPGDQIVADCDAVLVIPQDLWPDVEVRAREIQAREAVIRAALAEGQQLAELIELPREGQS